MLNRFNHFSFILNTNSMEPFLLKGDTIFLKKISFSKICVNDFIATKRVRKYLVYRVVYKASTYLITKADNEMEIAKINPEQIIGKVYRAKRNRLILDAENAYLSQSILYMNEITVLNRSLQKEEIDYLFLKGTPLYLHILKKAPSRIYADCDLLVKKNHFLKIENILLKLGYRKTNNSLSKTHIALRGKEIETSYYKIIDNFPIVFDVHSEVVFMMTQIGQLNMLYPQRMIDNMTQDFLKRKILIKIGREKFPILSSNDLIYYLALHIFHHNFNGYNRYDFFNSVLHSIDKDFKTLGLLIKKFRTESFVYPVFLNYQKYYDIPLPEVFLEKIKPKDNFLSRRIMSRIDIFAEESRIKAGVNRFLYLFVFSPFYWHRKILIFLNAGVLLSITLVLWRVILVELRLLKQKFTIYPTSFPLRKDSL